VGLGIGLILLVSALTGIFLAWKKDIDLLQPPTQKGEASELSDWLPLQQLADSAQLAMRKYHEEGKDLTIDRMDVRPAKGVVKVLFEKGWWEAQVDGSTGRVLSIARRHSDWIEKVHDGSIVSDGFKLLSMNVLGIGCLVMITTGLWLWYGPKLYRQMRRHR
jgi:uncharacterized iron-regulated membrane protein